MYRGKLPPEEKIAAVKLYIDGKGSLVKIAQLYGVDDVTLNEWVHSYKAMGADAFFWNGNKKYSAELKANAVQDYLSGKGSLMDISKKYGLKSTAQLRCWIKVYNSYGTFKSSATGRSAFMTKGRKTTIDERIEIVQYCIANDYNYSAAAEKYGVSYQQARNYTVKYQDGGVEALQDRRGKRKDADQMDEMDRLRAENKLLKAEKERAEMEVSFLKKLEEIERRRG